FFTGGRGHRILVSDWSSDVGSPDRPDGLLTMIPPRPPGYPRGREHWKLRTSPVFDALAPAEAAAQHTLQFLFAPERAARLIEQRSEERRVGKEGRSRWAPRE